MDKPFALFGGDEYYPYGGFLDFRGTFATLEGAVSHGDLLRLDDAAAVYSPELERFTRPSDKIDWYHVVDLRTMQIVARRDQVTDRLFGKS